jgi:hypothetical protein
VVDSGALCTPDLSKLSYERVPRPIFPLDDFEHDSAWRVVNPGVNAGANAGVGVGAGAGAEVAFFCTASAPSSIARLNAGVVEGEGDGEGKSEGGVEREERASGGVLRFFEDYEDARRPALIQGLTRGWRCHKTWTREVRVS